MRFHFFGPVQILFTEEDVRWTPLPAGVDCASFSNTFPPLAIAVSLSQSRKVCPTGETARQQPFQWD